METKRFYEKCIFIYLFYLLFIFCWLGLHSITLVYQKVMNVQCSNINNNKNNNINKKKKKKIEKLTKNNNTFTSEPAQILFLLCISLNSFSLQTSFRIKSICHCGSVEDNFHGGI